MKHLKKIMAVLVTMVMVLGMMSMAAFGAETTKDRTISVSGLDEGDKVTFYKVLEWAKDSDTAKEKGAVQGWYWTEPFATIFNVGDGEDADHGAAKLYAAINDKNQLILTDNLAGDIARAINSETSTGITFEPVASNVEESGGTATYTFEGVAADDTTKDGLYMAIITPADQDVVYNPVFIHLDSSTDEDNFEIIESSSSYMDTPVGTGAAKKSRVTLTKESKNDADYTDTLENPNEHNDNGDTTKPGDVLDFTVTSTIPGYGDTFNAPFFNLKDEMNGLILKHEAGDIKIKVDGVAIPASNYTLTATDDYYEIKFTSEYLKTLHVPAALEVTYKAEVDETANTNVVKEKNTVVVDFSHDPTTENDDTPGGEKQYKKDITNHYTFSIDANNLVGPYGDRIGESGSEIIKIGVDKDGNPLTSEKVWSNVTTNEYEAGPLAGAEFKLYGAKLDENGKVVIDTTKELGTATSDASGRLNFTGLDAGVYFLQETKAPAGYVKNSDPVKITIAAEMETRTITEYYDQDGNWYTSGGEGRTKFEYETEELKSYSVTYGEQASSYTFGHAHESSDEIKWSISESSEAPQSIKNTKGVELPSTGGIGTTIFYIVGAILVVGAGVLLVTRRRMAED